MNEARDRAAARSDETARAKDELARFWEEFLRHVNSTVENEIEVVSDGRDGERFLRIGDRRIALFTVDAPTNVGPALVLGTVRVQAEGSDALTSDVANVCAVSDSRGDLRWQLVRFDRNDLARPPAFVDEARSDGRGAVAPDVLDCLLTEADQEGGAGMRVPSATIATREPLTVDTLLSVVAAELQAFDDQP